MKLPAFDPYAVLGLPSDATTEQIRAAHRRLAKDWHPDRNPARDAADRFNRVAEAYEWLGDADRRREYDEHRRQRREAHERKQAEHARSKREQAQREQEQLQREREQRAARERAETTRREEEDRRRSAMPPFAALAPSPLTMNPYVPTARPADDPQPDPYEIRDAHDYAARRQVGQDSLLDAAVEEFQANNGRIKAEPILDRGPTPVRETARFAAFGVAATVAFLVGIVASVTTFASLASAAADASDGQSWSSGAFYGRLLVAGLAALIAAVLAAMLAFVTTFGVGYVIAGVVTAIVIITHGPHGPEQADDDEATRAARREARRVTRLCVRYGRLLAGCLVTAGLAACIAFWFAPHLSQPATATLQVLCAVLGFGSVLVAVSEGAQLPFRVLRNDDEAIGPPPMRGSRRGDAGRKPPVDASSTVKRHPDSFGEWVRTGRMPPVDHSPSMRRQPRPSVNVAPIRA